MIEKDFAEEFARERIEAWDSHDLDRGLSHYSDQFEMSSPPNHPDCRRAVRDAQGQEGDW